MSHYGTPYEEDFGTPRMRTRKAGAHRLKIYHYHDGENSVGAVELGGVTCRGVCGGKSEECARVATLAAMEKLLLLASGPAAGILLPRGVTQILKAAYDLLHAKQQELRGEVTPGAFDAAIKQFQASSSAPIRAAAAAAQELAKSQAMMSSAASAINEQGKKRGKK